MRRCCDDSASQCSSSDASDVFAAFESDPLAEVIASKAAADALHAAVQCACAAPRAGGSRTGRKRNGGGGGGGHG